MTLDLFSKQPPPEVASSAILSSCGEYRYRLERVWDTEGPRVAFIMLNPSTADASKDDPTIRRCIGFAKAWGFGGLIVGNLFALRSADPLILRMHHAPIGPENNKHLSAIARGAEKIICAWGTHGALHGRDKFVMEFLRDHPLAALKVTADGHPGHPLYVAAATVPKPYFGPGGAP